MDRQMSKQHDNVIGSVYSKSQHTSIENHRKMSVTGNHYPLTINNLICFIVELLVLELVMVFNFFL